jgi:hypothetical protein
LFEPQPSLHPEQPSEFVTELLSNSPNNSLRFQPHDEHWFFDSSSVSPHLKQNAMYSPRRHAI